MITRIINIRNWASYFEETKQSIRKGASLTSVAGVAVVKTSDKHFLQPRLAAKVTSMNTTTMQLIITRKTQINFVKEQGYSR